jgi:hypothetical protein
MRETSADEPQVVRVEARARVCKAGLERNLSVQADGHNPTTYL